METESDHDLILTKLKIYGTVKCREATNNRDYSNFNEHQFKLDLLGPRWTEIYSETDVKVATTKIANIFTEILKKNAPKNIEIRGGAIEVT